jgi:hypothetical protein
MPAAWQLVGAGGYWNGMREEPQGVAQHAAGLRLSIAPQTSDTGKSQRHPPPQLPKTSKPRNTAASQPATGAINSGVAQLDCARLVSVFGQRLAALLLPAALRGAHSPSALWCAARGAHYPSAQKSRYHLAAAVHGPGSSAAEHIPVYLPDVNAAMPSHTR